MGVIGLILSIFWGHMYYSNKKETKALIAKVDSFSTVERAAKLREDSISLEVRKRDSAIKSLSVAQNEAKESLNEAVRLGKALSLDLRRAKADRDTTKYYAKCDSLADQVAVLEQENASYQNKVDLLNLSYSKQLADKDTLLAARGRLYSELRKTYAGSILKIDNLENDKTRLQLKVEKQKRTTRLIAFIGAAVAGSVYIMTK